MTLTDDDLDVMREAQESQLPDECVVTRATNTADAIGGKTQTWATVATLACRLSSHGAPAEYLQAAALRGRGAWMVTLPYGSAVTREDRLTIDGRVLEILGFASGGAWETALRAVCMEVL